jgi:hypothetical protein
VKLHVWRRTFKGLVFIMSFSKFANMLPPMKKELELFVLNIPRKICQNALLVQINLLKVVKNGTRLALKLV